MNEFGMQTALSFILDDLLYLQSSDLKILQSIGVTSLKQLSKLTSTDLVYELNISMKTANYVIQHSKLLSQGKIPVYNVPQNGSIIWFSPKDESNSLFANLSEEGNIEIYSNIEKTMVQQIIVKYQPIILGMEREYLNHPLYWPNYLNQNVLIAQNNTHDFLFSRLFGHTSRTYEHLLQF